MPSSRAELIPEIIRRVRAIKPASVLDVGFGFGKYGFLLREYLDVLAAENSPELYQRCRWRTRMDGIEAHRDYYHGALEWIYDAVFWGNAIDVLPLLESYDVILIASVLEHLEKPHGRKLLELAKEHTRKLVLVTTPAKDTRQGPCYGNPLEAHRCVWSPKDFEEAGYRCEPAPAHRWLATSVIK
jgi:2-polyprenyl-3-methyl-5-hydroxy-6-metoxy-1,4-benzoquinol methylase